jgi:general secretion pathway protein D
MLLKTGQLAKKVLNENTLLVYPALPAKLKEYQDLVVKSFFLGNTEAKQIVNLVRSMTKTRDIYIDEKLNLLIVRDTPEAVRLVEKLGQWPTAPNRK